MKILIIYRINIDDLSHSGALIKMNSQRDAFEALGHSVDLINHDEKAIFINGTILKHFPIKTQLDKYIYSFKSFFKSVTDQIDFSNYDLIYIRYPFSNQTFLNFCKAVKTSNSNPKLVLEIPTYPYNKEFKGIKSIYPIIDNFYRLRLKKYVDKLVHFGAERSLWGISTIRVTNGIAINKFILKQDRKQDSKINLIAVGKWSYWHGLDRLIEGLNNYYSQEEQLYDINLNIIGTGDELKNLKRLVGNNQVIRNRIKFSGVQRGEKLDSSFEEADIGIGTLGIHRKGLKYNASLKHREYCARGIKFILSTNDEAFPKKTQFVRYVPHTNEAIDIKTVIELHLTQIQSQEIRKYCENKLSWKRQLSIVLKELS